MNGHVAEWRGMGLQNLLRRFESVHDLLASFIDKQLLERAVFLYGPYFLNHSIINMLL